MDVSIRLVSADNLEDWLSFFDKDAFSDNPDWSFCYCGFYFFVDDVWNVKTKEENRADAINHIKSGKMQGYLAYQEGKVVGWVNAADRLSFERLCSQPGFLESGEFRIPEDPSSGPGGSGKAIVCYLIRPDMRGRGIASALLARVVLDAAAEGFSYVEAYPVNHASSCAEHYHGPASLYEKAGFQKVLSFPEVDVWRKLL